MPRDSQSSPFTQIQRSQGLESKTQRFLSALETTLIELVEFLTPFKQPQPWTSPTFLTNWADSTGGYFRGQYRITPLNEVVFRGSVTKGSAAVAGEVVFVLPLGFRPKALVSVISANTLWNVTMLGEVKWLAGVSTNASLDQIRFSLEAA